MFAKESCDKYLILEYFEFSDRFLIVVFTGADDLDHSETSLESFIETSPANLKNLIEKAGNRVVAVNNRAPNDVKQNQVGLWRPKWGWGWGGGSVKSRNFKNKKK
jgi:hypothetical protein